MSGYYGDWRIKMAMTKEQQKAASDRIMAKMGPMTPFEAETYRKLTMKPPYPQTGEVRRCWECGAEFQEIPATKEKQAVTALEQFVTHTSVHNPSPAAWTEAHSRIQAGKESAKDRS